MIFRILPKDRGHSLKGWHLVEQGLRLLIELWRPGRTWRTALLIVRDNTGEVHRAHFGAADPELK